MSRNFLDALKDFTPDGSGLDRALWEFIDPLGDANLALTGTALEIAVPGNAINHGIWTNGNFAPRAMQAIPNVDFQVVAKFESDVSVHEQIQGILVEQDPGNVIRFEIHHFGSIDRIFSATIFGTTASIKLLASIGASAPMWLRVTRTGNDFLYEYSFDGTSYGFGASFSAPMTVNKVGVFAGNTPGTPHTMRLDYFFNTATPIEPEDGGDHTVNVAVNGGGSVMRSPAGPTYETGTTLQLDALPTLPDWVFDGWTGDITTASNPLVFDVTRDVELTANFLQVQDTTPPLISALAVSPGETSATVTWVTDEPASSAVDYGPTAAYTGSASDPAPKTAHALVLGGLAPDTEYPPHSHSTIAVPSPFQMLSSEEKRLVMTVTPQKLIWPHGSE